MISKTPLIDKNTRNLDHRSELARREYNFVWYNILPTTKSKIEN